MNFWKTFFAALLALVVGSIAMFILSIIFGFSLLASMSIPAVTVPERSVLCINLNESIIDSPNISPLNNINPETMTLETPITLFQAISAIEKAANDDNIECIYLYLNGMGTISASNIEELRSALERFKLSGKSIVAFDDMYTQGEYYLASKPTPRQSMLPSGWSDTLLATDAR